MCLTTKIGSRLGSKETHGYQTPRLLRNGPTRAGGSLQPLEIASEAMNGRPMASCEAGWEQGSQDSEKLLKSPRKFHTSDKRCQSVKYERLGQIWKTYIYI